MTAPHHVCDGPQRGHDHHRGRDPEAASAGRKGEGVDPGHGSPGGREGSQPHRRRQQGEPLASYTVG